VATVVVVVDDDAAGPGAAGDRPIKLLLAGESSGDRSIPSAQARHGRGVAKDTLLARSSLRAAADRCLYQRPPYK